MFAAIAKWKNSLPSWGLKENPVRSFFFCWGLMFTLMGGIVLVGMLIGGDTVKPSLWYVMALMSFLAGGLWWTNSYPLLKPAKRLSAKRHVAHFMLGYAAAWIACAALFWIEKGFSVPTLDDGITYSMGAFVIATIGKGSVYARSAASHRKFTQDRRLELRDQFGELILRTARSYEVFSPEFQDLMIAPMLRALSAIEDRSLAGISFVTGLIHTDYLHAMNMIGMPTPMIFQLYRQGVETLNQPNLTDEDVASLQSLMSLGEEIIRENKGERLGKAA